MWLDTVPFIPRWFSIKGALLVHVYWWLFTTLHYYPLLLPIEYFTETWVWLCVRGILSGEDRFPPSALLTTISYNFTLEVELAGVFVGFFCYHYLRNKPGTVLLGSTWFILIFGGIAPLNMIAVGLLYSDTSVLEYNVFWLAGFAGGITRAAALFSIFGGDRMDTWRPLIAESKARRKDSCFLSKWGLTAYFSNDMFAPLAACE
jgi:hypothetical protein